jgi:cysteine desulfurase/selenocysteine lyase
MTTNNIPFGVPDPDEIARLANAFFSGWPGNAPGVGGVSPAPGGTAVKSPPTARELLVPVDLPPEQTAPTPAPEPTFDGSTPSSNTLSSFNAFAFSPFLAPSAAQTAAQPTGAGATGLAQDFPILGQRINGHRLVWLDNAATTQKPQCVIDRISQFYETENSNVHRAAHTLAARSTDAYEAAREKVRRFLGAASAKEIVFVRGATEAINLVAQAWGRANVKAGDEIILTWLEHHANIVPWQQLCAATGAKLRVVPVDDTGTLRLDEYERLFTPNTKFVSATHVSNALGTINPVEELVSIAHRHNVPILIDGAQAVSHQRVNVTALGADFYVFSGHKVFGPTGIGVLYGKKELLERLPPWQSGGNMIADVTFERTTYQKPPARFEAGTGNIADAVGLGAAIDYLDRVGLERITAQEGLLLEYGAGELARVPGLRLIGSAPHRAGVLSFVMNGRKPEDISKALDERGIAVRAGHHCAQPILRRFGVESTVRASLALYNTHEDLEALIQALYTLK